MMKTNRTIQKIKKRVSESSLIKRGDKVLVALSGGADSVFLLYVLDMLAEEMGFSLYACHVEHGIRGRDAVDDMHFCRELCDSMKIPFCSESFDVPAVAAERKISEEAAGREVRYKYFREVMEYSGCNLLATAHHRDDKTETVLMNILRGCSLRGYAGIEYVNGNIIRPLLDITKSEIVRTLEEYGIAYRTDKTNSETDYTRNKIRLELIPALREYNPAFDESILRQSKIFTDEDNYMNICAETAYKACMLQDGIDISALKNNHIAIQRRVLYLWLTSIKGSARDISEKDIEALLSLCEKGETGKDRSLTGGLVVGVNYGRLVKKNIAVGGDYEIFFDFDNPAIIPHLGIKVSLVKTGGSLSVNENDVVAVRNRRDGDRFYPVGMNGSKKLKDFFSDNKIPSQQRDAVPVLTINGEIAAIAGMREDRRYSRCGGTCKLIVETI